MRGIWIAGLLATVVVVLSALVVLGTGRREQALAAGRAPVAPAGSGGTGPDAATAPRLDGPPATRAVPERTALLPEGTPGPLPGSAPGIPGRVLGPGGLPVEGARVLALPGPAGFDATPLVGRHDVLEARTGADGGYRLPSLAPGPLRLAVRAAGYAPHDDDGLVLAEGEARLPDVVLVPGVLLAGTVVDPAGSPVAGARLLAASAGSLSSWFTRDPGEALAKTDAGGRFRIDVLAGGAWSLVVRSDAHPDALFEGELAPGGTDEGLRLVLPAGRSIAGRVAGPAGTRFEELLVRADPAGDGPQRLDGRRPWREGPVLPDGRFEVRGLADGRSYELRAGAPRSAWTVDWRTDTVEAAAGARDVVIEIEAPMRLVFRVVDAGRGTSLEHFAASAAFVDDDGRPRRGAADPTDAKALERTPDGRHVLPVARGSSRSSRVVLTITGEELVTTRVGPLAYEPGATVELADVAVPARGTFHVLVVDAGGAGVGGAEVHLQLPPDDEREALESASGTRVTRRTDGEGRVLLPRVRTGVGRLQVSHPDYAQGAPARVDFATLPADDAEHPLLVRLVAGGTVTVRVVGPDGRPAAGATVQQVGGTELAADDTGTAVFGPLAPGPAEFFVSRAGSSAARLFAQRPDEGARGSVQVVSGGRHELVLTRPAAGTLQGRVTEAGRPLGGAELRLANAEGRQADLGTALPPDARTDGAGGYRLGPVDAGDYELFVAHPARSMEYAVPVRIEDGLARFDVDLPVSVVEGRVVDERGLPVEGATVTLAPAEHFDAAPPLLYGLSPDGVQAFELETGTRARTTTGADGRYAFTGVAPGVELLAEARHPYHVPARTPPLVVAANSVRSGVDLVLRAGGVLRVLVRHDGLPLEGVLVRVEPADGRRASPAALSTDAAGRAQHEGLEAGTWRVVLAESAGPDDGGAERARDVRVLAGELVEVDFDL